MYYIKTIIPILIMKTKFLIVFLLLASVICSYAQENQDETKVFDVVQQMPSFPGGQNALLQYLKRNIKYPLNAERNGIQGRVIVTFIVEKDGSITGVSVISSVEPSLDEEAVRVVKNMPNWIPGKQKNKPVRVKYTVPITFRMGSQNSEMLKDTSTQGINLKPLRDRCVVKSQGEWYFLNARLLTFNEYPELQRTITKALFGIESVSIKDGYHRFVNGFDGLKPYTDSNKAKGKEINILMRLTQGTKGKYMSLSAEYTTVNASKQTNKYLHLIFNELTTTILTAEDILAEPYLTQYRQEAQGTPLQFYTDKSGLNYGSEKDGLYHNRLIPYTEGDSVFTDYFKTLINMKRQQVKSVVYESAQEAKEKRIKEQAYDENRIYDEVDEMPTYPGGTNALNNFISTHMYLFSNYKEENDANGGRIVVEFIIEKDGSTSNHKVTKSSSLEYDADAIRLVKKMPKWTPGKLNGQPVRVRYSLPILYVMHEN